MILVTNFCLVLRDSKCLKITSKIQHYNNFRAKISEQTGQTSLVILSNFFVSVIFVINVIFFEIVPLFCHVVNITSNSRLKIANRRRQKSEKSRTKSQI